MFRALNYSEHRKGTRRQSQGQGQQDTLDNAVRTLRNTETKAWSSCLSNVNSQSQAPGPLTPHAVLFPLQWVQFLMYFSKSRLPLKKRTGRFWSSSLLWMAIVRLLHLKMSFQGLGQRMRRRAWQVRKVFQNYREVSGRSYGIYIPEHFSLCLYNTKKDKLKPSTQPLCPLWVTHRENVVSTRNLWEKPAIWMLETMV